MFLKNNLPIFNDYFVENFHSSIRSQTAESNTALQIIQKAKIIDTERNSNFTFKEAFVNSRNPIISQVKLNHLEKKVFLFLVGFVFIIIYSFSMAFHVLLSPKLPYSLDERTINNDPNNPWSLTDSYYQKDLSTPLFIQKPDKNTNMFTDYGTSLFSMYLYLIGIIHLLYFLLRTVISFFGNSDAFLQKRLKS